MHANKAIKKDASISYIFTYYNLKTQALSVIESKFINKIFNLKQNSHTECVIKINE